MFNCKICLKDKAEYFTDYDISQFCEICEHWVCLECRKESFEIYIKRLKEKIIICKICKKD